MTYRFMYVKAGIPYRTTCLLFYAGLMVSCSLYDPELIDFDEATVGNPVTKKEATEKDEIVTDANRVVIDANSGECFPNPEPSESCPLICPEKCDGKDNDCDGDTDEDEAHADCAFANTASRCTLGKCEIVACQNAFGNCDDDISNGCERSLDTILNCGDCDQICEQLDNATQVKCKDGVCTARTCYPGFGDCDDKPANGCETRIDSLENCGACGVECKKRSCAGGICTSQQCEGNLADCDGNPDNGCETSLTSLNNCVKCGNNCSYPNATASCESGVCEFVKCRPNYADCDQDLLNGCETPIDTPTDCGNCNVVCDREKAPFCSGGVCTDLICPSGYGDCDSDPANGCETDFQTIENCGSCGRTCVPAKGQPVTCQLGKCVLHGCEEGFYDCDGDPSTGCESQLRDDANCGACGESCKMDNATTSCSSGRCELVGCDLGFADCNADTTDGCETQMGTVTDCGGCGDACEELSRCEAGYCISGCNPLDPISTCPEKICGISGPIVCCTLLGECGCTWFPAYCL